MNITATAQRFAQIINDSIRIIQTTKNPETLLSRYGTIEKFTVELIEFTRKHGLSSDIERKFPDISEQSYQRFLDICENSMEELALKNVRSRIKSSEKIVTIISKSFMAFGKRHRLAEIQKKALTELHKAYIERARAAVRKAKKSEKEDVEIEQAFEILRAVALDDVPNGMQYEFVTKLMKKIQERGYSTREYDYLLSKYNNGIT